MSRPFSPVFPSYLAQLNGTLSKAGLLGRTSPVFYQATLIKIRSIWRSICTLTPDALLLLPVQEATADYTAARKVFRLYEDRIDFTYLTGLPMEELLEKVANLPVQTLVMYLLLLEDGAGKKFDAPESLSQISRASNAPLYGFWDVLLGHGIVGGYLNSFEEQGKMVAQLGVRILNGEKPADIPVIQAPKFQNI